jgi:cytochrome bd-type quinol oxidase subunit 1
LRIALPKMASLILTHDLDGEVQGLNDFIGEHPPVAVRCSGRFASWSPWAGHAGRELVVAVAVTRAAANHRPACCARWPG